MFSLTEQESLYTKLDSGLKTLLKERAEKQGVTMSGVVADLIQKGLDTEDALKEVEKLKEVLAERDLLKTEIIDLKQSCDAYCQTIPALKQALGNEFQRIYLEEFNKAMDRLPDILVPKIVEKMKSR